MYNVSQRMLNICSNVKTVAVQRWDDYVQRGTLCTTFDISVVQRWSLWCTTFYAVVLHVQRLDGYVQRESLCTTFIIEVVQRLD